MVLSHWTFSHVLYSSQTHHQDPETTDRFPPKDLQVNQIYKLLEHSLLEPMRRWDFISIEETFYSLNSVMRTTNVWKQGNTKCDTIAILILMQMYLLQSISSDSSEQSALPSHTKWYSIQSPLSHTKSVTAGHDPGCTASETHGDASLYSFCLLVQNSLMSDAYSAIAELGVFIWHMYIQWEVEAFYRNQIYNRGGNTGVDSIDMVRNSKEHLEH